MKEAAARAIPFRNCAADRIAQAVMFFERQSDYITGQVLSVNGLTMAD
jgi:hypothetical protein